MVADTAETGDERSHSADARGRRLQRAAEDLRAAVRRQDGRETPVGPRAMRTRATLLDTAQRIFAERGYLATSLADIAQESGVSLGTVYQYFADRDDIVATLAAESALRMLDRGAADWDSLAGRLGLRRAIAALVTMYWENREFFSLWESASHSDVRLAHLRRELVAHFRYRFARELDKAVDAGAARAGTDVSEIARAMTLMVSSYCYDAFVFDPPTPAANLDEVIDMLTTLWADAIGLREPSELFREAARSTRSPSSRGRRNNGGASSGT